MSFFPWNKKDKKAKEKKSNNAEATSPASGSSNDIVGAAIAKPLQDDSSTNTCQTEINNPGSDQVILNNPENSSENSTPVKSTSKASTFFNTKMSSEKKAAKTPEESDFQDFLEKAKKEFEEQWSKNPKVSRKNTGNVFHKLFSTGYISEHISLVLLFTKKSFFEKKNNQ